MRTIKYRHEYKIHINIGDYYIIRNRVKQIMKLDKHAKENGKYTIRSVYFDNLNDTALFEKISGINHREKFRIRFYNGDSSFILLEKKTKDNGLTAKQNTILTKNECIQILRGNIDWLNCRDEILLNELYVKMKNRLYRPKTIVDYMREAYTYSVGNVRITFDSSIRSGLFSTHIFNENLPTVEVLDPNTLILEVKFDEFIPDIIADIIQTGERQAKSVSKYALSRTFG
ncbi:polyphosphate polymerase domain-containing protein [Clostridium cochlearium]|uniref:Polyphosphate polymerase domain-containing protein n=1 Tax=Clostridium cochlearium TaxID=1494 RepID=A0A7Y3V743_CLOCO|nr:polyphosphate polymerase domain-containing protein [Clostridium cochlearium]MBV1818821.1 polyphosphate polymerase domain-containing protein [Bacteroidales bacterium MSK.15.36]MCG4572462.1 polyphosphate polymerase domain-containing protein [Clostridium cochlearium]NOH15958.1 polyphosphate polymerase domain-containing protein [Clostridium cochlearium]